MDRLDLIETFATVARNLSFSRASQSLGQPLATVSRKVSNLEDYLGVQLLVRTTRSVRLTPEGTQYLEKVFPILNALETARDEVAQTNGTLSGELAITSPVPFGTQFLVPLISRFLAAYPDISVRHYFDNSYQDYVTSAIDLGLRIGLLPDSGLRQIKLGAVRVVTCASPDYLEEHGTPQTLEEVGSHRTIAFGPFGARARWNYLDRTGQERWVEIDPVYTVDSVDAIRQTVLNGSGIGKFYSYQVAELVACKRLKLVLTDFELEERPVSFLYPDVAHLPRRTRTFLDFATPLLRERLAEIARLFDG